MWYNPRIMKKSTEENRNKLNKTEIIIFVLLFIVIVAISFLTGSKTFTDFRNAYFGGNAQEVKDPTIKVGIYECLSGEFKQYGKEEAAGIELAHDLYPTVLGRNIELIYADNRSNIYDARQALQALMSQNPSFIFGSYSDTLTLVASDYVVAANTPAMTITSINPLITANNDFYFTTSFSMAKQGAALGEYAVNGLGKTSFATVKSLRDDSSTAFVRRFRNKVGSLIPGDDVFKANISVDTEIADYKSWIQQLKDGNVEAVLLAIPPAAAQVFMSQAKEMEYLPQFLGTGDWDTKDFEKYILSNPELSVSYPSVQAAGTTDTYSLFIDAYYNKYGENAAEPSGAMAAAFDAYLIMIRGMEDAYDNLMATDMNELRKNAGTDAKGRALIQTYENAYATGIPTGTLIKDAIKEITDFEGATGILSYDGTTEVNKTVTISHFFKGTRMDPYTVEDDKTITGDDTPLTEIEEKQAQDNAQQG